MYAKESKEIMSMNKPSELVVEAKELENYLAGILRKFLKTWPHSFKGARLSIPL